MDTKENKNSANDKSLISPEKINTVKSNKDKKISVNKNDIVEREGSITTDDGRQLLK